MKLRQFRRVFRGGVRAGIWVAVYLALPAVLSADTISPGNSSLWYAINANTVTRSTNGLPSTHLTAESSLTLQDDVSYADLSGNESQAVAYLYTLLQSSPTAHTEVSVWSSGGGGAAAGSGTAEVWYEARLDVLAPPPVSTAYVPVRLHGWVLGSADGSGNGGGAFSSGLTVNLAGGLVDSWYANQNTPEVEVNQPLQVLPGGYVGFHLTAGCNAWALSSGGQGYCSADADPTIVLDQAAFDASMGAQTYQLSDYYSVEYSSNLTPEPTYFLPLAIALASLACLRQLSKRRSTSGEVL